LIDEYAYIIPSYLFEMKWYQEQQFFKKVLTAKYWIFAIEMIFF
jgi:hypothetical protein